MTLFSCDSSSIPGNVGNVVVVVDVVGHCCLKCDNKLHGCLEMFVDDRKIANDVHSDIE